MVLRERRTVGKKDKGNKARDKKMVKRNGRKEERRKEKEKKRRRGRDSKKGNGELTTAISPQPDAIVIERGAMPTVVTAGSSAHFTPINLTPRNKAKQLEWEKTLIISCSSLKSPENRYGRLNFTPNKN